MIATKPIYIFGSGAVGFPLAVHLANAGKRVIAVRTSRQDVPQSTITITVQDGAERISAQVETVSLSRLAQIDGMLVVAAKSYANSTLARELKAKGATGPLVIMQNGIGVERPFLEAHNADVYRCILYVTSQATANNEFAFRPVTASPIGTITGSDDGLHACVDALNTPGFPFRAEAAIQREIWKKAIINAVFNSICPLLDVDNGIFVRDAAVAALATEIVKECVSLTDRLQLGLSEPELLEQIMRISTRSNGQFISTLQDIRAGRETEIAFLNLEIARVAALLEPSLQVPRVALLGAMIAAKSQQRREPGQA